MALVEALVKAEKLKLAGPRTEDAGAVTTRTAVMGLFGMMNWLYTWYNPRTDPDAETLARELSDLFLRGVRAQKSAHRKQQAPAGEAVDGGSSFRGAGRNASHKKS